MPSIEPWSATTGVTAGVPGAMPTAMPGAIRALGSEPNRSRSGYRGRVHHGWLTTLRPDGAPQSSRVWFVQVHEQVWVATSESALKVRDIRHDPRVSFVIEGIDGGMTGVATIEPIDSAPGVLHDFAEAYGGWDAADPGLYGPRVLIRISLPQHRTASQRRTGAQRRTASQR